MYRITSLSLSLSLPLKLLVLCDTFLYSTIRASDANSGRTWALPRTSLSNDGHGSAACDAGRANYIALCLTCATCNETESINQMTVV